MKVESRATLRGVPGDAARRRGLRRIFLPVAGFAMAFGCGVGLALGSGFALPWWLGAALLILTALCYGAYCRKQPALVYGYFKGARGEEMVAGELAHLPAEWTIFNGILLPNGKDVDHVAVGPQGIFVIETKHWSGDVAVEGGKILANGRPLQKDPVIQVRQAREALAHAIGADPTMLHGVLCFVGRHFMEGPARADEVLVCSHERLTQALTQGTPLLDAATLAQAVTRLGSLTLTEGL